MHDRKETVYFDSAVLYPLHLWILLFKGNRKEEKINIVVDIMRNVENIDYNYRIQHKYYRNTWKYSMINEYIARNIKTYDIGGCKIRFIQALFYYISIYYYTVPRQIFSGEVWIPFSEREDLFYCYDFESRK